MTKLPHPSDDILSKSAKRCAIVPLDSLLPQSSHLSKARKIFDAIHDDGEEFKSCFGSWAWDLRSLENTVNIISSAATRIVGSSPLSHLVLRAKDDIDDTTSTGNFEAKDPKFTPNLVGQLLSVSGFNHKPFSFPSHWEGPYANVFFPVVFALDEESDKSSREMLRRMFTIFQSDPRRIFMYGLTMSHTQMQLWYCSRSAIMKSPKIALAKDHIELTHIIVSLAYANPVQCGKDPTMIPVLYMACGKDSGCAPQVQHRITVGPSPTSPSSKSTTFVTQKLLYQSPDLLGRATRVWEVYSEEEDEHRTKKDRAPMVLMDVWLKPGDELENNLDAYNQWRIPAKVVARGPVKSPIAEFLMAGLPEADWDLEDIEWITKVSSSANQEPGEQSDSQLDGRATHPAKKSDDAEPRIDAADIHSQNTSPPTSGANENPDSMPVDSVMEPSSSSSAVDADTHQDGTNAPISSAEDASQKPNTTVGTGSSESRDANHDTMHVDENTAIEAPCPPKAISAQSCSDGLDGDSTSHCDPAAPSSEDKQIQDQHDMRVDGEETKVKDSLDLPATVNDAEKSVPVDDDIQPQQDSNDVEAKAEDKMDVDGACQPQSNPDGRDGESANLCDPESAAPPPRDKQTQGQHDTETRPDYMRVDDDEETGVNGSSDLPAAVDEAEASVPIEGYTLQQQNNSDMEAKTEDLMDAEGADQALVGSDPKNTPTDSPTVTTGTGHAVAQDAPSEGIQATSNDTAHGGPAVDKAEIGVDAGMKEGSTENGETLPSTASAQEPSPPAGDVDTCPSKASDAANKKEDESKPSAPNDSAPSKEAKEPPATNPNDTTPENVLPKERGSRGTPVIDAEQDPYMVSRKGDASRVHYRIVYKNKSQKTLGAFKDARQFTTAVSDAYKGIAKMNEHGDFFGTMSPDFMLMVRGEGVVLDFDGAIHWEFPTPEVRAREEDLRKAAAQRLRG